MISVLAASALVSLPNVSQDTPSVLTWLSGEIAADRVLIPNKACDEAIDLGSDRVSGWMTGARALRTRKDGDTRAQRWVLQQCPDLVDPQGEETCLMYVAAMAYELHRSSHAVQVVTEDHGHLSHLTASLNTLGVGWQRLRPWLDYHGQP